MTDDALRVANERINRFKRLGGVDLKGVEPEEKHPLLADIRVGLANYKRAKFIFRCPLCAAKFASDQEMEPLCTGPNQSLDEHEPTVMVLRWKTGEL